MTTNTIRPIEAIQVATINKEISRIHSLVYVLMQSEQTDEISDGILKDCIQIISEKMTVLESLCKNVDDSGFHLNLIYVEAFFNLFKQFNLTAGADRAALIGLGEVLIERLSDEFSELYPPADLAA